MGLIERFFDPWSAAVDPESVGHPGGTRPADDCKSPLQPGNRRRQLREAVDPQPTTEDWFWGRASATGSEEDYFWRRLSDNWPQKDVLPGTYLEIHNQVYEAYNANPMANAIVEMGVNFVLGDGLQIDCRNKKVQRVIDAFWSDADNHMNLRQYEMATELSLYGEIFVRFFVNPFNGGVKIALLDPSLVDQIECDPENTERQLRLHRWSLAQSATIPVPPGAGLDARLGVAMVQRDSALLAGVWYLAGSVKPGGRWLAFLAFPFVFNFMFQFGFYNFSISLALKPVLDSVKRSAPRNRSRFSWYGSGALSSLIVCNHSPAHVNWSPFRTYGYPRDESRGRA